MLRHKAIPCCIARCSVSTCDHHQMVLNSKPASSRLGSHSRTLLLTRWVRRIGFGSWRRSFVSTAEKKSYVQGLDKSYVQSVAKNTIGGIAENTGTGRIKRRDVTRRAKTITPGREAALPATTKEWQERHTGQYAKGAVSRQSWFTTSMGIDLITSQKILKSFASVAVKSTSTTVQGTFLSSLTPQRYSQYPGKPGISTLNYGKGKKALAEDLGVTQNEAGELIELYFAPYPRVREFIENTHCIARTGMVETLLGRPRRFPELEALGHYNKRELTRGEWMIVARAERQDTNSRIQGSAADVVKMAMLRCEHDPDLKDLGVEMILQIHDELIFEVPIENVKEALPYIKENMEHPFDFELDIPLRVDAGTGYSWSSAKG